MVFFKNVKAAGLGSGLVAGGFCLLGFILLAIAATVVLSLISLYNPNHGQQGYGDAYSIRALGIESQYTNISTGFTTNNTIVVNRDLSTACSNFLKYTARQKYLAGCVINPHNAIVSGLSTQQITRRKRDVAASLISVATASVYYQNTCGKLGDKGKYVNSTSLSDCVKLRLLACNQLYNNTYPPTTTNLTSWPLDTPIAYAILSDDRLNYVFATVGRVFGIQPNYMINAFYNYLSPGTRTLLQAGCQYLGPISLADIAAILAAQNGLSYTTTTYSG